MVHRSRGTLIALPVAPGRFELVRDVPHIPRIFRRTYAVTFVARSDDGTATTHLDVVVK